MTGHPQHRYQGRDQQHGGEELTHGAATADPGDKHAHERRPRNPPCPVERSPALAEISVLAAKRI